MRHADPLVIAGLIVDGRADPLIAPFGLDRFNPAIAAE